MLRTLKDLESYRVTAADGDIGKVSDFYFDDQHWTIRYLVVDTGGVWQGSHRVLISPIAFRQADWSARRFHLALDRDKVKNSPTVDLHKPVSRQYERSYNQYYGWAPYWGFGGSWNWGVGTFPGALASRPSKHEQGSKTDASADIHLWSALAVAGNRVSGSNGELGHIADFIVDDETWAIRYLVVDTRKWLFGKKVLVAPHWAREISWPKETVYMDISRETIKSTPAWRADEPINREYEARLYDYHGQPAYWLDTDRAKEEAPVAESPDEKHPTP